MKKAFKGWISKFKTNKRFVVQVSSLLTLAIVLTTLFNNCGNIKLQSIGLSSTDIQGVKASTFPVPLSEANQYRIVFFVDMSISMEFGLCPLDEAADSLDAKANCSTYGVRVAQGADPLMNRFNIMRSWINEIHNSPQAGAVRYLIVPFTGGEVEANRTKLDKLAFVTESEALTMIDTLQKQQNDSIDVMKDDVDKINGVGTAGGATESKVDPDLRMGTSVPSTRLDNLKQVVDIEASSIQGTSIFEIVMMSDGVPKPRNAQMTKAVNDIWTNDPTAPYDMTTFNPGTSTQYTSLEPLGIWGTCPAHCENQLSALIDGSANAADLMDCGAIYRSDGTFSCFVSGDQGYTLVGYADSIIGQFSVDGGYFGLMKRTWGDYAHNSPNQIVLKINEIKNTLLSHPGVTPRISMALIDSIHLSPENNNETNNWMILAKSQKVADRIGYINDSTPPFTLIGIGDHLEYFKIGALFVVNPNVRVDSQGHLMVDSLGDGLSDTERAQDFANPQNPLYAFRNNQSDPRANGKCLNYFTAHSRCPASITCDALLDIDGDGLNECEEIIFKTSPRDFDTSGDSIPDSLKFLYGYNPTIDNSALNTTGFSNLTNFKLGLPPFMNPSGVNSGYMTQYNVYPMDYTQTDPNSPKTANYKISIQSMPVANPIQASIPKTTLYYDTGHTSPVPVSLVGAAHAANVDNILVLARIDNGMNASDVHWGYIIIPINALGPDGIAVDLHQLTYFSSIDPQKGAF